MCALLYTTLFSTLLYVGLTLCDPILGCGHTLSLRRCGDCLICVFLILYLYNVVSGDCDPHFVFTPRILRVTWVSKPLLTLPLLFITTTRHYHYTTLHNLPTLSLLSLQAGSTSPKSAQEEQLRIRGLLEEKDPEFIFNCDETAFFWKSSETHGLSMKHIPGQKMDKS